MTADANDSTRDRADRRRTAYGGDAQHEVQGLPAPEEGVYLIVSALVAQAAKRADVVSPATGHPDVVRDQKGQIASVPGFVRAI